MTGVELLPVDVCDELAALVRVYPLPENIGDADMNMDEIASAFGHSVNSVGKWVKAGMPVVQEGGNGKAYVLRLSHCWAWRQDQLEQTAAHQKRNQAIVAQMQMAFLNVDSDDPGNVLSAKDRKGLAEADFAQSRAMQARRQLVLLEDVIDLLEDVFKEIRDSFESLPDRLERELNLKPEEVKMVERFSADVLQKLEMRLEDASLEEKGIGEMDHSARVLI